MQLVSLILDFPAATSISRLTGLQAAGTTIFAIFRANPLLPEISPSERRMARYKQAALRRHL
jgi:hypothetical protein